MAESVDLLLDADDEVSLGLLAQSLVDLRDIVSDVADAMYGKNSVTWIVETLSKNSPARLGVRPTSKRGDLEEADLSAIPSLIGGAFQSLRNGAPEWPPYFSEKALDRLRDLARQSGDTLHVRAGQHGEVQDLDSSVVANIDRLLAPSTTVLGTVEGRLEGLSIHDRSEFSVYDHLDGRRIRCSFGGRVTLEEVRAAIGRRVGVYGLMRVRDDGVVTSMTAESLEILPSQDGLPDYRRARGMFGAI